MESKLSVGRDFIVALAGELSLEDAEKPAVDGGWSIAQILEHLAITERGTAINLQRALREDAADAETLSRCAGKSELIATRVAKPMVKVAAPEVVHPKGKYGAWPGPLTGFVEAREKLIQLEAAAGVEYDERVVPHPILGELTLRQWFEFATAHGERHREQMVAHLRSA
jgi:uncharacterized damage-inducible protein DinB